MAHVRPLCSALAEIYFTDRYPGFDLEDPNWPKLRQQLDQVTTLAQMITARVKGKA
jgi:hypothetical protein